MQQHVTNPSESTETISGFVLPEQWDEQFRVTQVVIACNGERDIRVENLDTFPMLLSLARQRASITGTIRKVGDVESIRIESISPAKPAGSD